MNAQYEKQRIEQEAEELFDYTQHDYSPVKPHDFITNFVVQERNKLIDDAIRIIKDLQSGDKPIYYNQGLLEAYRAIESLKIPS